MNKKRKRVEEKDLPDPPKKVVTYGRITKVNAMRPECDRDIREAMEKADLVFYHTVKGAQILKDRYNEPREVTHDQLKTIIGTYVLHHLSLW